MNFGNARTQEVSEGCALGRQAHDILTTGADGNTRRDSGCFGVFAPESDLLGELGRHPVVVVIAEANHLTAGGDDAAVAAASQTAGAGVGDNLQGTVFADLNVLEAVGLNTVKDDNDFNEAAVALLKDGTDSHAKQFGALAVGRDNGGNSRVARGEVHHWDSPYSAGVARLTYLRRMDSRTVAALASRSSA